MLKGTVEYDNDLFDGTVSTSYKLCQGRLWIVSHAVNVSVITVSKLLFETCAAFSSNNLV